MQIRDFEHICIVDKKEGYYTQYKGRVYYDRLKKQFVQIREVIIDGISQEGYICGGFCDYYRDSRTNIQLQRLKEEYIVENLVAVNLSKSDLFYHDGIGWRVNTKTDYIKED